MATLFALTATPVAKQDVCLVPSFEIEKTDSERPESLLECVDQRNKLPQASGTQPDTGSSLVRSSPGCGMGDLLHVVTPEPKAHFPRVVVSPTGSQCPVSGPGIVKEDGSLGASLAVATGHSSLYPSAGSQSRDPT